MQFLRRSGEQGAALRRRRPCNMRRAACSVQRQRAARSVQRYPDASGCERYKLFVQRVYYAHTASSKSPESFGSCCPPALTSPRSLGRYVTLCRWPRAASVYFLDVLPSLQPSPVWCCLRNRHDNAPARHLQTLVLFRLATLYSLRFVEALPRLHLQSSWSSSPCV